MKKIETRRLIEIYLGDIEKIDKKLNELNYSEGSKNEIIIEVLNM
ncbi:hypothetical protein [Fusobacterium polymorphum]